MCDAGFRCSGTKMLLKSHRSGTSHGWTLGRRLPRMSPAPNWNFSWKTEGLCIGGSKGGARDVRPPGSKFFHFHAVFGKKLKNKSIFGSWRPPWGKSWICHCFGSDLTKNTTRSPPPQNYNFSMKTEGLWF